MGSNPQIELYQDDAGEHRWRFRVPNGNIMADSGEGYETAQGAREAANRFRALVADAEIVEEEK